MPRESTVVWWKRRPGVSVALIGTDGTGKTTQAKALTEFLTQQHIPVQPFYRFSQTQTKATATPSPAKQFLKSIPGIRTVVQNLNVFWIATRWSIPLALKIRWQLHRGRWVILDRHVFDLLTMPRSISNSPSFERFLRRVAYGADCMVYLFAEPEVIVSRKSDNTKEETMRQLEAYTRVRDRMTHCLDVTEEKEKVLEKILAASFLNCQQRLGA